MRRDQAPPMSCRSQISVSVPSSLTSEVLRFITWRSLPRKPPNDFIPLTESLADAAMSLENNAALDKSPLNISCTEDLNTPTEPLCVAFAVVLCTGRYFVAASDFFGSLCKLVTFVLVIQTNDTANLL
jgi:hypothetical protein